MLSQMSESRSLLASAACKGALFNVDINLPGLPDDMAQEIRANVPEIKENAKILSRQIMDEVRERLFDYLTWRASRNIAINGD